MGKFFNLDAPIIRAIGKVWDMILFSSLWLVCCIPIVTIGAANAALYKMMIHLRQDRTTKVSDFFRAFAGNFKKATALWLLLLAAVAVLLCVYYLVLLVENELLRLGLLAAFCLLLFLALAVSIYAFPLTAYFENTVLGTLRNAIGMGLGYLKKTIPACALVMLPLVVYLVSWEIFLRTMYLWVMLAPGAIAYGIVCLLLPVFREHSADNEKEESNEPVR